MNAIECEVLLVILDEYHRVRSTLGNWTIIEGQKLSELFLLYDLEAHCMCIFRGVIIAIVGGVTFMTTKFFRISCSTFQPVYLRVYPVFLIHTSDSILSLPLKCLPFQCIGCAYKKIPTDVYISSIYQQAANSQFIVPLLCKKAWLSLLRKILMKLAQHKCTGRYVNKVLRSTIQR